MTIERLPLPDPNRPGGVEAWVREHGRLPSVRRGVWRVRALAPAALVLLLKAPWLLLAEVRPVWVGLGRVVDAWVGWVSVRAVTAVEVDKRTEAGLKWAEQQRKGRRCLSLLGALALTITTWWAVVTRPEWVLLAGLVSVGALDALGRAGRERATPLPPPHRAVLKEGVPLAQVTEQLVLTALREGLEIGVLGAMRYDAARRQYRVLISCLDEVTPAHCRAFERGLGAATHSLRALPVADGEAGVREVVIRDGDPLNEVSRAEYVPTGAYSISDPIPLGASMTEVPFALDLAGEHVKIVGTVGSGKTAWALRNMIARVSAARHVALMGAALAKPQDLALWRGVLQRRAFTVEALDALLDELLAEITLRSDLLTRFAEDDDPANDHHTEWSDELAELTGRPAWVCFCDEWSIIAAYDGTGEHKDDPNLLRKAQDVVRLGRGVWVSLVMATQKIGNNDFGSQVMQDMANTSIALPCSPNDAVRLFGVERRDAGFQPHLLKPGTKTARNDAGKCYVSSPRLSTPDLYSFDAPIDAPTVKEWARRRISDGLTPMYPDRPVPAGGEELAVVVDPLLAELERGFDGARAAPSAVLVAHLREHGWPELTQARLAELVEPHGLRPRQFTMPDGRFLRGFRRDEVRAVIDRGECTDA